MFKTKTIYILVFSLMLVGSASAGILLDRVVAVVNEEVITWSDLYKAMEFEASEKLKEMKPEEKKKAFKDNEAQFLDNLIDMRLQLQAAKHLNMDASAEEIAETIADIRKKYSIDEKELIESLKKEGLSYDEYKEKIGEQVILGRVITHQVRSKIVIPETEVDKLIVQDKDLSSNSEGYRIRQIYFKKPSDSVGKNAIQERAANVYKQLAAGTDFASMAKTYSEDPSASTGGDMGFIKKSSISKGFADVLSDMKPGEISQPFWTDSGLHIVKLEEKAEKKGDTALKEAARNKLFEQVFMKKYKSWVRSLREKAYIEERL